MARSLYSRYRSQTFHELIGQDHIVVTLTNQIKMGTVAHAYLFTGIRGTGKTSSARILARAINCLKPKEGEPCNACEPCLSILEGRALDVVEIDAASNRGIDEMRHLRERVHFLPAMLKTKVYIIDEAHMLTTEAWNAFLKTLEEPPDHVVFILATTEPQRVPETVRSRVQRFDFRRLSPDELVHHIENVATEESIHIDHVGTEQIARSSHGSARDALSLLEYVIAFSAADETITARTVQHALGLADPKLVNECLSDLIMGNAGQFLAELNNLFEMGVDPRQLIHQMEEVAKDAAIATLRGTMQDDIHRGIDASRDVPKNWLSIVQSLSTKEAQLRNAVDTRLEVELALLQLLVLFAPVEGDNPVRERLESPVQNTEQIPAVTRSVSPPSRNIAAEPAPVPDSEKVDEENDVATSTTQPIIETVTIARTNEGTDRDKDLHDKPTAVQDTVQLNHLWQEALDASHKVDAMLAGVLRSCSLVTIEDGKATIAAPFAFHFDRLSAPDKIAQLQVVFATVDTTITTVEVVFGEPETDISTEAVPTADQITDKVMETFPGSQIVSSRLRDPSFERANKSSS